ncbi:hypothetical protein RF11_05833 [Thelohanellus kitauei]|uniref:Uncharacterized protein n=1 Tax=Thelohanellus kitauei TaxID=669202 RepID=A0A0C2M9Y2_THEKT|nr:hypothetical protein RF11_05833 [Thelohanellus kitauei]
MSKKVHIYKQSVKKPRSSKLEVEVREFLVFDDTYRREELVLDPDFNAENTDVDDDKYITDDQELDDYDDDTPDEELEEEGKDGEEGEEGEEGEKSEESEEEKGKEITEEEVKNIPEEEVKNVTEEEEVKNITEEVAVTVTEEEAKNVTEQEGENETEKEVDEEFGITWEQLSCRMICLDPITKDSESDNKSLARRIYESHLKYSDIALDENTDASQFCVESSKIESWWTQKAELITPRTDYGTQLYVEMFFGIFLIVLVLGCIMVIVTRLR